jgi:hypothetical protein
VVQLRAAMPIQVVTDHYDNFVERRVVRTDVLRERGDNIAELLGYWHALKGDDRVPSFADIDPVRLAQLGLLGRLHVLNCENPDPLLMRFDLYGNEVPLDKGRIYTGLGRRPPGPHPRADRRRRLDTARRIISASASSSTASATAMRGSACPSQPARAASTARGGGPPGAGRWSPAGPLAARRSSY